MDRDFLESRESLQRFWQATETCAVEVKVLQMGKLADCIGD